MVYFNYNGKLLPAGSPVLGADNRGLRYGDGLFETIPMKNGNLLFGDEHCSRLWKGLKVLQFDIPKLFTVEVLQKEMIALAEKNHHTPAARIRLNVFRGDGGLYDPKNHRPNYCIQTWALPDENGGWNSNGLVLGIYKDVRKSCDILSNLKHNNYLPYVMAAITAKNNQWNDAIILNCFGRTCDTTIANIFIIKDNIVFTPHLSEGCVAGVVRKMLIKSLKAHNWEVIEKELEIEDVLNADEVFLTNSMYNIRWVQRIGDIVYSNTRTQTIFAAFIQTIS